MRAILIALLVGLAACAHAQQDKKIVCYFADWTTWRPGNGQFGVNDVDAKSCTHLIYSFAKALPDGQIGLDSPDMLRSFVNLRSQSPDTKFMVAIGGWSHKSRGFDRITSDPKLSAAFVKNAVQFLKEYQLDGLDLDWEYPNHSEANHRQKADYAKWVNQLSQRFHSEGLLLSAAVAAGSWQAGLSYDIPSISRDLDFINLMAYDLHGSWERQTGLHGAISANSRDKDPGLNVEAALKYWLGQGADPQKIILGIPFYGRSFKLQNPQDTRVGAPISLSPGPNKGKYTGEAGMLSYLEICENLKSGNWKRFFDNESLEPYAVSNDGQWVGYDDKESIKLKMDLIKSRNLGGAMIWSLDSDDFRGICGEKNVLLNTVNRELRNGEVSAPAPPTDNRQIPPYEEPQPDQPGSNDQYENWNNQPDQEPPQFQPEQPQPPTQGAPCQSGLVYERHPQQCNLFYQCVFDGMGFIPYTMSCPANLLWDTTINNCNWPQFVQC